MKRRPVLTAYCSRCQNRWLAVYRKDRSYTVAVTGYLGDGVHAAGIGAVDSVEAATEDGKVFALGDWRQAITVRCSAACGREHVAHPAAVSQLLRQRVTLTRSLDLGMLTDPDAPPTTVVRTGRSHRGRRRRDR